MPQALTHCRWFAAIALAAIVSAIAVPVAAQNPTGTISGKVSDSGGLAVPGATVTVQSPNLQGVRSTVTSANGDYIVPYLPPGPYTVTVELTGFATIKQSRDVGAMQPVELNI